MSPGRVLVTGGAGFIGSHVCERYLSDGWDVTVLDDLSSGRRDNVPSGAELVEMDVRAPEVRDLFAERRFDVVNHHAAQIDVRASVADPWLDASINLGGLLNLLQSSVEFGLERFMFISSGGVVYGEPSQLPTPRSAPKRPLSPYGVSKLSSEFYLQAFRELHGLEYAALRYSNVYGPRQDPHGEAGVVAIFCQRLREGRSLTVFGDGEQTRDYVFVQDVAAANVLVTNADLPRDGGLDSVAFNVGREVEISVNDLARALMEVSGTEVPLHYEDARPGELLRSSLDCAETLELGWSPEFGLMDGLRDTYESLAGTSA